MKATLNFFFFCSIRFTIKKIPIRLPTLIQTFKGGVYRLDANKLNLDDLENLPGKSVMKKLLRIHSSCLAQLVLI